MPRTTDKYGTGARSVHRSEAPSRTRTPLYVPDDDVSGNPITWIHRAEQSNKTRLRTCCATNKFAHHQVALFVGCSQLENIFDHMCGNGYWQAIGHNSQRQRTCMERSTLLVMVVAAGKWARAFPSFHRAAVVLDAVSAANLPSPPTAVVSNFATAHLLHVHAVRPFFDAFGTEGISAIRCYPQSTCADFRGLNSFDTWVAEDLVEYRRRLPKGTRSVLMTPNWICNQKLYPQYKKQLALVPASARWARCMEWVREHLDSAPTRNAVLELCSRYTFTAEGSEAMAKRVRRAAGKEPVLDANAITRNGGGCNATVDARHYRGLVPEQERALRALL